MKHKIVIAKEKCIGCGKCVCDCPENNIYLDANRKATVERQDCIKCGHCSAICPKEAVCLEGYREFPRQIEQGKGVSPDELLYALQVRRSIRKFQDKAVSQEVIDQIIEAGRIAPTGANSQKVRFIILDKKKEMVEQTAVKMFRKILRVLRLIDKRYEKMSIDNHFFFKKAPLVIQIVADQEVNGTLAAANMALMAEALGLGVLYSGFFTAAVKWSRTLKKELGIRKEKAVITLVIGYPAVHYQRTALKEEAKITYQ